MTQYVGRFAPSPTGPLHAGSLVSALASWVDARHHNGQWLLRLEDIDPSREVDGASRQIISCLEAHGLIWDGDIFYQSNRSVHYERALQALRAKKTLYACQCTRKYLRSIASEATNAYPGFCRDLNLSEADHALRVKVPDTQTQFDDQLAGFQSENVANSTGDFIVRRRGPLYAYQLAVVVDDAQQGITHIVRGADLLDNTARQIAPQQILDYSTPKYLHLPIVVSDDGRKLSKQTGAAPLDSNKKMDNLRIAWDFLGQNPIVDSPTPAAFLEQALVQWQRQRIPRPQN